jgi:hypothetical protein
MHVNNKKGPANEPPRVFDTFAMNDEVQMAIFRLKELDPVVDYFVIGESPTTFSGYVLPLPTPTSPHFVSSLSPQNDAKLRSICNWLPAGVRSPLFLTRTGTSSAPLSIRSAG